MIDTVFTFLYSALKILTVMVIAFAGAAPVAIIVSADIATIMLIAYASGGASVACLMAYTRLAQIVSNTGKDNAEHAMTLWVANIMLLVLVILILSTAANSPDIMRSIAPGGQVF